MLKNKAVSNEKDGKTQRLDKWLWFTRITKTRTLAATLVKNGKVRVNRERTGKPGHMLKIDDVVTIAVHGQIRVLQVAELGTRRGPSQEAIELYRDLKPPDLSRENKPLRSDASINPPKRPTKRERRELNRLRRPDPG